MRQYTAKSLIATYNHLNANPQAVYLFGEWPGESMSFCQWRKWFIGCLNAKINRNEPARGKKDTPEYRRNLARDVRIIREYYTTRIRQSGCRNILTTPEAKRLYPHVDCQPRD